MRKREENIDLKLTDYILRNYKKNKLFLTHNHPSNLMFIEIIFQLGKIVGIDLSRDKLLGMDLPELPGTNCPISPYDIKQHEYKFPFHQDWFETGSTLINKIISLHRCL